MKIVNEILEGLQRFDQKQLDVLVKEFSKIKKIDPTSPRFKKMEKLMGKMKPEMLQQIVDQKIKFLDTMAKGILRRRKEG